MGTKDIIAINKNFREFVILEFGKIVTYWEKSLKEYWFNTTKLINLFIFSTFILLD